LLTTKVKLLNLSSLATTNFLDTTQGPHIDLPLAYWSSSQVFTWPHPLAFLCHLYSSATLTWPSRSLCPGLSRERWLLWLRHEPLQSLALRFGTNSFLLRDPLY